MFGSEVQDQVGRDVEFFHGSFAFGLVITALSRGGIFLVLGFICTANKEQSYLTLKFYNIIESLKVTIT